MEAPAPTPGSAPPFMLSRARRNRSRHTESLSSCEGGGIRRVRSRMPARRSASAESSGDPDARAESDAPETPARPPEMQGPRQIAGAGDAGRASAGVGAAASFRAESVRGGAPGRTPRGSTGAGNRSSADRAVRVSRKITRSAGALSVRAVSPRPGPASKLRRTAAPRTSRARTVSSTPQSALGSWRRRLLPRRELAMASSDRRRALDLARATRAISLVHPGRDLAPRSTAREVPRGAHLPIHSPAGRRTRPRPGPLRWPLRARAGSRRASYGARRRGR